MDRMADLVDAELTLRIPRDGERDIRDEARERLAGTAVVERVEAFDVTGVRPRLNDLQVRANATVACVASEEARRALEDATGIETVEQVSRESTR
jgi:hypothetical protein